MPTFPLLLAAGGWEQIIVVIVFFLISALGQLLSSNKEKQRHRPQAPKRQPGAGPQPPQPKPRQEELRGEVEDFLRQMRGEKPAKKTKPPRRVPVKVEAVRAEPIVLASEPAAHESVQEHVTRHISTSQIRAHASHLGAELEQTDERMAAHLQETFQHRLGNLQHAEQLPQKERRSPMAEEVAKMLASPQGMQQAILASEILRRPEL